jgi:sugar lactone lactonase YvrE
MDAPSPGSGWRKAGSDRLPLRTGVLTWRRSALAVGACALLTLGLAGTAGATTPGDIVHVAGGVGPGSLTYPEGVAVDASGNVFIADTLDNQIDEVSGGVFKIIAGTGVAGYSGDNGPAVNAELDAPADVAVDALGNIYIADTNNNVIREIGTNGVIYTLAGNGSAGYSGDGGPAAQAQLDLPDSIAVVSSQDLYVADTGNDAVRYLYKIQSAVAAFPEMIKGVAGNGFPGFSGDGGPAASSVLNEPDGVATDSAGNLYISDGSNSEIREVVGGVGGTIKAVGYPTYPTGVAVSPSGVIYASESVLNQIVSVTLSANTVVAGTGAAGQSGDGGPAVAAQLNGTSGLATDASNDVFLADSSNNAVREIVGTPVAATPETPWVPLLAISMLVVGAPVVVRRRRARQADLF